MALKCDLAARLIGRDDAKARRELDALVRLAAQARADILAVTTDRRRLSLRAELDTAAEVLASAGINVQVRHDAPAGPIPDQVDAVLATVLREAVTNVLRHATATRCAIELTVGNDAVSLLVANDGASGERSEPERGLERRAGGRGLANLSARAVALGGHLTVRGEGCQFELTVRVPLPGLLPESAKLPPGSGAV